MSAIPRGFVGGSAEPSSSEPWPLELVRDADGTFGLELVSPGQRQRIHAIHETLAPLIQRLPLRTELHYYCRVADGRHYNVLHLIAVEVADQSLMRVVNFLDDGFVRARPGRQLARAQVRWDEGDQPGAIEDLRAALNAQLPAAEGLCLRLDAASAGSLADELAAYVATLPFKLELLLKVPLERWPTAHLVTASQKLALMQEPFSTGVTLETVHAELSRRGDVSAGALEGEVERRAKDRFYSAPERLLTGRLAEVLRDRTSESIRVYGDALAESGHPYGEFLALHARRDRKSLKRAKDLAAQHAGSWLGPLAPYLVVEYVDGLPEHAELSGNPPKQFDWDTALASPLLKALRGLVRKRTKKQRWSNANVESYLRLVKALAGPSLAVLDGGDGVLEQLRGKDLSGVTHLFALSHRDAESGLDVNALPSVQWVEVRVARFEADATFDWLAREPSGFWAGRRPHLDLVFARAPTMAEREQLRRLSSRFSASNVTLAGEPL